MATRWGAVALIVAAGIAAALQVGKAAIAAPMLQADLGLGLSAIGWLTGVFALLGLVGGIPAGALVAVIGGRRILALGLLATAAGSALGASAGGFASLLVSRIVEGAGFLLITVAAPSILEDVAQRSRRDLVFALWSCFMPAGMAIAMLAGPLFDGWRGIWWAGAGLALAVGIAVPCVLPPDGQRRRWSWQGLAADATATVSAGGPLGLAAAFALYSLMFFALFGFLPVLLMERMQATHQMAGLLSALATAANILGNLAAGLLLSRGVGRGALLAGASLAMGVAGLGIFLPVLPDMPTFGLCVLFSAVGGLIPAVLLSSAPLAAPTAGLVPIGLGLMVQGNNLGQIAGPVAVGSAIQSHGWTAAGVIVGIAALAGMAIAVTLGRALRPAPCRA
ncbi:MAG: MFS transporter [Paracoccus sp. BP8]|nr:MAG: MFS transporter [Paracoccus sp. BP8]